MERYAVIIASHIPSVNDIWVGKEILEQIRVNLPNSEIFVGINPSPVQEEWINVVKEYTSNYNVTPNHLVINSDASAYQTALKMYKNKGHKDYDLVWFLHTQGTKSGRHDVRRSHLKTLLDDHLEIVDLFKRDKLLGAYGNSLSPLPSCWGDSEWDFYLGRFGLEFVNRPIRCFLVGTMYVIRGYILNNFIFKCNDSFFNEILHNPHTNGSGDPWFFERDFIHIVDGFTNHYIKSKYTINNYNIPLNGLTDNEHYEKLLNNWRVKNNMNE